MRPRHSVDDDPTRLFMPLGVIKIPKQVCKSNDTRGDDGNVGTCFPCLQGAVV